MTDLTEIQLKITAVEFALSAFAEHENEGDRKQVLRDAVAGLGSYVFCTETELRNEKKLLLLLLNEKKSLRGEKTLFVQIRIGDKVHCSPITFTKSKRPLDTVKEEVSRLDLLKRGMSLDSYRLVTVENVHVTDFSSCEGLNILIFDDPAKIVPLPGIEWTDVQLDQLSVRFQDVERDEFFSNAELQSFQMSERGDALVELLKDIDISLHRMYEHISAEACCINPMLQNPICKALSAAITNANRDPFIDDFVKHLLREMGFYDGSLFAVPQMSISLVYGETEKMAIADVTVIDLWSLPSISVVEDASRRERRWKCDSTAQLIAQGIAITQHNEAVRGQKRDAGGNLEGEFESSIVSETVYGIRVTGTRFHFYAIQVSPEIHAALRNQTAARVPTTMYRYISERGLDFMVKRERDGIIMMLSLLQEVARKTGYR